MYVGPHVVTIFQEQLENSASVNCSFIFAFSPTFQKASVTQTKFTKLHSSTAWKSAKQLIPEVV